MTNFYLSAQGLVNDMIKKDREDHKKPIQSWQPSKLGSCLTGVYLERLGIPPDKDFDERTLRVFSAGKLFEDWLINQIKKSNVKCETQVRIQWPEYDVSGYADMVVENEDGKCVYEIKSKHSKSFWYMVNQNEGANFQHKMQLWLYMKVLTISKGIITYISKDDLSIVEFPIFLKDTELEKAVMDELKILKQSWELKRPPPPPIDSDDWRVKYCRWHKQCINQKNYLI